MVSKVEESRVLLYPYAKLRKYPMGEGRLGQVIIDYLPSLIIENCCPREAPNNLNWLKNRVIKDFTSACQAYFKEGDDVTTQTLLKALDFSEIKEAKTHEALRESIIQLDQKISSQKRLDEERRGATSLLTTNHTTQCVFEKERAQVGFENITHIIDRLRYHYLCDNMDLLCFYLSHQYRGFFIGEECRISLIEPNRINYFVQEGISATDKKDKSEFRTELVMKLFSYLLSLDEITSKEIKQAKAFLDQIENQTLKAKAKKEFNSLLDRVQDMSDSKIEILRKHYPHENCDTLVHVAIIIVVVACAIFCIVKDS